MALGEVLLTPRVEPATRHQTFFFSGSKHMSTSVFQFELGIYFLKMISCFCPLIMLHFTLLISDHTNRAHLTWTSTRKYARE